MRADAFGTGGSVALHGQRRLDGQRFRAVADCGRSDVGPPRYRAAHAERTNAAVAAGAEATQAGREAKELPALSCCRDERLGDSTEDVRHAGGVCPAAYRSPPGRPRNGSVTILASSRSWTSRATEIGSASLRAPLCRPTSTTAGWWPCADRKGPLYSATRKYDILPLSHQGHTVQLHSHQVRPAATCSRAHVRGRGLLREVQQLFERGCELRRVHVVRVRAKTFHAPGRPSSPMSSATSVPGQLTISVKVSGEPIQLVASSSCRALHPKPGRGRRGPDAAGGAE